MLVSKQQVEKRKSFLQVSAGRDAVLLCAGLALSFTLAGVFDLFELWMDFAEDMEAYELDELPVALSILTLGAVWYATRRWRDYRRFVQLLTKLNSRIDEARREAVEANRTKSNFLANTSHELRTPLNAILGFSEMIKENMFGEDPDRYRDYAKDIHSSAEHLLSLINDLLDIERLESGKIDLANEPVDLVAETKFVCHSLSPLLDKASVNLQLHLPDETWVLADTRALRQIITNLLSNAIKFNCEGGDVIISLNERRDGAACLSVKDTGCGIAEEELDLVFDRFYRATDVHTNQAGGTGVGLAVVQQLVEKMGGQIRITSVFGAGTELFVELPLADGAALEKARGI